MIFEEETIITYFAHNDEQEYDDFEEAKQAVIRDVAKYCNDYAELVRVKKVEVTADGSYKLLSGRLTHDELVNLEEGQYLCYSVYAGNGAQVFCQNLEKVNTLIALNKLHKIKTLSFVRKETMTVRDQTNDRGFDVNEPEILEGLEHPIWPDLLEEDLLNSDYAQNGVGLNLINEFEHERIEIYV